MFNLIILIKIIFEQIPAVNVCLITLEDIKDAPTRLVTTHRPRDDPRLTLSYDDHHTLINAPPPHIVNTWSSTTQV